eukprot:UN03069
MCISLQKKTMSSSGLGVTDELRPCRVEPDDKGQFTTYTLNFRIA